MSVAQPTDHGWPVPGGSALKDEIGAFLRSRAEISTTSVEGACGAMSFSQLDTVFVAEFDIDERHIWLKRFDQAAATSLEVARPTIE